MIDFLKKHYPVFIIAGAAFVLMAGLMSTKPIESLEYRINDQLFEWRGSITPADTSIALVAISEQADDEIPEKYPWPTSVYARAIENLNEAGAKAIIFDVVFNNTDQYDAANDSLFAEAMAKHGNVILAGDLRRTKARYMDGMTTIFPNSVLKAANPNRTGFVQMRPSVDGSIRSYPIGIEHQGTKHYMLGIEGIRLYTETPYEALDKTFETPSFSIGPYPVKLNSPNSFLINFYGPDGTFPTHSFEKVIDDSSYQTVFERDLEYDINTFDDPDIGLLQQEVFKDKIVIIGSTMPTLQDFHQTPFANQGDNARPGYQIHAHAMQTILDGNFIFRVNNNYIIAIIFLLCLLTAFTNSQWGALIGSLNTVLTGALFFGIVWWAFMHHQTLIFASGPLLALLLSQVGMITYQYYTEQKEKKRIRGMFSSYVSPELVEQMIESGEEPKLGGEERYMTAFFSDIVSFSTFSEQLEAKQLVQIINEYLSAMTKIINQQNGTLDKFIGDAIVAFYGSPVPVKDHARQACITSQLMHKELDRLRKKWKKDGWPNIVVNMQQRIGMNTGPMVTGNMGSEQRFNYTMMGDNVNLAARCESGAKQYGVFTMVTETTKTEAQKYGDECVFRFLDQIVVKGRTQPVKVYEIAGLRTDADQELLECIELYEEGMELYFGQNWDRAIAKFKASARLERHSNNPSLVFIERCKSMKTNPPPENWNGVFVMQTK